MVELSRTAIPSALGPLFTSHISMGIQANGLIFLSGMIGIDPETHALEPDLASQTRQAWKNIKELLVGAGSTIEDVVKATIFVTGDHGSSWAVTNPVWNDVFGHMSAPPARESVQVTALYNGALIELSVVAISR